MKITKISEQLKNSNRVSIYVDGKYGFSLSLDQLLELRLKTGSEIDEQALTQYKKISQDGKLKMRALEWLMIRPHSAKELKDYLKRKSLSHEIIDDWVKDFQAKRYVDDESFSKWWVGQRRDKQKSAAFIKYELQNKGVADEVIKLVLEGSEFTDTEALKVLIAKKRGLAKYQDEKKLIEYLLRQGYRYSLVKEALAE